MISKTMRRVLRKLHKGGPYTAEELNCSVSTLIALERRRLVSVETTFNSVAFPRRALAYLTKDGAKAAR